MRGRDALHRLQQRREVRLHLAAPRAGHHADDRRPIRIANGRDPLEPVGRQMIEQRVSDERRVHAAIAEPFFLERKNARQPIDAGAHLLDPSLAAGPELRRDVIQRRHAHRLGHLREAEVEARRIDANVQVRPLVSAVPLDQPFFEPADLGDTLDAVQRHRGFLRGFEMNRRPRRRHRGPADGVDLHVGP